MANRQSNGATTSSKVLKPKKPHPDFPLYAHAIILAIWGIWSERRLVATSKGDGVRFTGRDLVWALFLVMSVSVVVFLDEIRLNNAIKTYRRAQYSYPARPPGSKRRTRFSGDPTYEKMVKELKEWHNLP